MNVEQTASAGRRISFALIDLFLVLLVAATWTAAVVNRRRNDDLQIQIARMRRLASEIVVDDESKAYAVSQRTPLYDDHAWSVYLPAGQHRLCMATRDIAKQGYPALYDEVKIAPGLHQLLVRHTAQGKEPRFRVYLDDRLVFDRRESADWNLTSSYSGPSHFFEQREFDCGEPIDLRRIRVDVPPAKQGSGQADSAVNGHVLWIKTDVK